MTFYRWKNEDKEFAKVGVIDSLLTPKTVKTPSFNVYDLKGDCF